MDTEDIYKLIASAAAENSTLTTLVLDHRPVIKHGGDQRDPTEEITCTCSKKEKYSYNSLSTPYWYHLFKIVSEYISTRRN